MAVYIMANRGGKVVALDQLEADTSELILNSFDKVITFDPRDYTLVTGDTSGVETTDTIAKYLSEVLASEMNASGVDRFKWMDEVDSHIRVRVYYSDEYGRYVPVCIKGCNVRDFDPNGFARDTHKNPIEFSESEFRNYECDSLGLARCLAESLCSCLNA